LKVSNLKNWVTDNYAKEYYSKGYEALIRVYYQLIKRKQQSKVVLSPKTPKSAKSDSTDYFFSAFKNNKEEEFNRTEAVERESVELEINALRLKVKDQMFIENPISTKLFWQRNALQLPNLYEIALILLNVQASSAFIERFFSICGVVCSRRATNMKPDLIIKRSMLKSNIHILNHLNSFSKN
jgi:tRNA/tmRNA/rRNA uracil-C5-methylase (TrmA/RlmC/RlmD family)